MGSTQRDRQPAGHGQDLTKQTWPGMVMVLLGVLALWWYRTQVSTSAEVDRLEAGGSGGQSVLESTVMFAIPVLLGFGMLWLIFVLARKD